MKRSANVLVLVGDWLAPADPDAPADLDQIGAIEQSLRKAGHILLALVRSPEQAMEALAMQAHAGPARQPELLVIDIDLAHGARAEAVAALVRRLDVPVVHAARSIAACERAQASSGVGHDHDIVCLLEPRELSLAIGHALREHGRARMLAKHEASMQVGAGQALTGPSALVMQQLWSELLRSAPVVFYSSQATAEQRLGFVSENVGVLLGYQAHELMVEPGFWITRVHPEDVARILDARTHLGEGEQRADEYRIQHRDGSHRWILDTYRRMSRPGGELCAIAGSWLDITARKQVEETLQARETLLETIMADQTELICRMRIEGNIITFVNDAYCRFFGKRADELIGHSFMPPIPEEQDWVLAELSTLGPARPVLKIEARAFGPGGEIRWQHWTIRAILNDAGQMVECQSVGYDVTERRLAEEALRRSEARYAAIFHLAPIAMWEEDVSEIEAGIERLRASGVVDVRAYFDEQPARLFDLLGQRRILSVNDATVQLFGARDQEEMARSFERTIVPESFPGVLATVIAMAEGMPHHDCEMMYRSLQGEYLTVLLRVSFPSRERKLENMLLSCVDITARKRAEEKIRQLNMDLSRRAAELQAANAELESFGYSVSHDLRAPLRAMDGFSLVLLEDHGQSLDSRGMDYLRRIRLASQRMSRLIDALLGLSRMSRSAMNIEDCDLSALADELVRELQQSDPARHVDVVIEPGLRAQADRSLLRVVLQNLLGNAWKFTSKRPRARIELGSTTHAGRRAYLVRDDGAGFDMAYAGKLFGPFQRLHGVDEFEGTGIGLATVQRIIRRHGGEIWAEGKLDAGATFTFTLP